MIGIVLRNPIIVKSKLLLFLYLIKSAEVMRSLENLILRYPEQLVSQYGAKAGVLMYVAEQLPDIPQMPMIVSGKNEKPGSFLRRAEEAGLKWPRIFRSSAAVELIGYEGDFFTHKVDTFKGEGGISRYFNLDGKYDLLRDDAAFDRKLEELIEGIARTPHWRYPHDKSIPKRINVIAVEVAPSRYVGTLIQHPNDPEFYIATVWNRANLNENTTFTYNQDRTLKGFGKDYRKPLEFSKRIHQGLNGVFGWHNRIASLPEMDPDWAYQIEFGLEPEILFQVRPFKRKLIAPFTLSNERGQNWETPIVIGITPRKGLDFTYWFKPTKATKHTSPNILHIDLRAVDFEERLGRSQAQAYLLQDGGGMLTHADVKAIRHSSLVVIYPEDASFPLGDESEINIVSDGRTIKITDKTTGKELK